MSAAPSMALAEALAAGRARYNALFAQARRQTPQLDPGVFGQHLRDTVGPIVEQAARIAPGKTVEIVDVLYEFSLTLVAKDLFGPKARQPVIAEGWNRLLNGLPGHLAAAPRALAGSVTNALYQLSLVPTARPREWIDLFLDLGRRTTDTTELLEAGKVAAWYAGMAHFREGALDVCSKLGPSLVKAALRLPDETDQGNLPSIVAALRGDPWLTPAAAAQASALPRQLGIVAAIGGFRGFGGPFLNPPRIAFIDGHFYAADSESMWLLTADCFGATLHHADVPWPLGRDRFGEAFAIDRRRGKVVKGKLVATLPDLADWTSAACDDTTLAVTVPGSHRIFLVAARAS